MAHRPVQNEGNGLCALAKDEVERHRPQQIEIAIIWFADPFRVEEQVGEQEADKGCGIHGGPDAPCDDEQCKDLVEDVRVCQRDGEKVDEALAEGRGRRLEKGEEERNLEIIRNKPSSSSTGYVYFSSSGKTTRFTNSNCLPVTMSVSGLIHF
jgi:hypothetical protein